MEIKSGHVFCSAAIESFAVISKAGEKIKFDLGILAVVPFLLRYAVVIARIPVVKRILQKVQHSLGKSVYKTGKVITDEGHIFVPVVDGLVKAQCGGLFEYGALKELVPYRREHKGAVGISKAGRGIDFRKAADGSTENS